MKKLALGIAVLLGLLIIARVALHDRDFRDGDDYDIYAGSS
jgi:hypothetical protein